MAAEVDQDVVAARPARTEGADVALIVGVDVASASAADAVADADADADADVVDDVADVAGCSWAA